ncbi:MAG TPA: 16S rRNA (guanine(527)-N(7))-methyltransferase RsmG [Anaerolineaceae bacterium]|jgi:16S rRNA (guanine527-N7)-methyltransferase
MEKLRQEALDLLGLNLTDKQISSLMTYEKELIDWNSRFNLTAIRDTGLIRTKHFLDSFSCMIALRDLPPKSLIDIGTGAGFPGIPIKIILPKLRLTLVESVGKKANFCQHLVEKLELEDVSVLTARAEEIGQLKEYRQKFDWAVARSVANLPVLVEYLLPLVKVGGRILAQKGENAHIEANAAEHALSLLGGRLRQLMPVTLPGVVDERFLIVIDKIAATPPIYPRKTGIPVKKPL